jgi:hypothetical protein
MNITGNEGSHKNDDKKTIDLSAELKATTARRRQKVSQGPGEPRARRQAPSGNRRVFQPYSEEMKQESLPNNTRTPIRRVPISRISKRRRARRRLPRTSDGSTIRIPNTQFIKLSSINSVRSSSESDKAEQKTLVRPTDQLERAAGLNQANRNNRQIDSDYEFALQLQMTETGDKQPRRNVTANRFQPSTSVNVQFFSDNGRGQNNRMSMVHSRNADDGTSTTIRVNQANRRANSDLPVLSRPISSQIERDAELARRIMESDIQDSEDDQDSPFLRARNESPINTNHRFASDEALARRIQEELYKEQVERRPSRSLPMFSMFPPRRLHMEEDDDFFSDYSDGYVSSFLPDHSGWRRLRPGPVSGGIYDANVDSMDHDELLELGERIGHVSRGAKQSTINELPTRKFVQKPKPVDEKTADTESKESDIMSCCICMIAFKTSEDVRTLPCLHIYHTKCIDKWLLRNRTCPICKFDITQNSLS